LSRGLGYVQANIRAMLIEDGYGPLTVKDVISIAGEGVDPRHIRRAFRSLVKRGLAVLTIRRGQLAIRLSGGCSQKKPFQQASLTASPPIRTSQTSPKSIVRPSAPLLNPPAAPIAAPRPIPKSISQPVPQQPAVSPADAYALRIKQAVEKQKMEAVRHVTQCIISKR
jgi:hypothetical protein